MEMASFQLYLFDCFGVGDRFGSIPDRNIFRILITNKQGAMVSDERRNLY